MTIFRLKQLASTSIHAAAGVMHWNYDRAELIADGVVHIIGVCLGLVAATALIVLTAVYASTFEITVVSVYVAGLLAMIRDTGKQAAELIRGAELKVYAGAPHGFAVTHAQQLNEDLLAFLQK